MSRSVAVRVLLILTGGVLCLLARGAISVSAQRGGMFLGSPEDPAIAYSTAPLENAVAEINRKLRDGSARLTFDGRSGYLRSALSALDIPNDSQMLVFSQTSFQRKRISEANPRALFFNDRVALGWVRDGEIIEVAAQDAKAGIVFYTLDQRPKLLDLLRRVRCPAAGGEGSDLSEDVGSAFRRGRWPALPVGAIPRGSAGHCRNPEGHEERPPEYFQ